MLFVLLPVFSAGGFAQTTEKPGEVTPSVITVIKLGWDRVYPMATNPALFPPFGGPPVPPMPSYSPPRKPYYQYRARVLNARDKTIRRVVWDYVFIDPTNRQEVGRHRFYNEIKIKSGKQNTLEGHSPSPPTHVISAAAIEKNAKKPYEEVAEVKCIAYDDGTFWRSPELKNGGCAGPRPPGRRPRR